MNSCNYQRNRSIGWSAPVWALALLVLLVADMPDALAHHAMGGERPATFMQGLLSGLGHPLIGIDHLAFIVAMGVAVGVAGLGLMLPGLFVAASALGVALHVNGVALPIAEFGVAASVLLIGAIVAWGGALRPGVWAALFAVAGLFHGHAFGESIFGAEPTPLSAYLAGLIIVQAALATAVALVARRSAAAALPPRLAGAAVAAIGVAVLAGQFFAT
jgi:urease accessory protein